MSVSIVGPLNTGAATGGAGVATSTATSTVPVNGRISAVYIEYLDSAPATSDVTIATAGNSAPSYTILSVSNSATNAVYYPRAATRSQVAAALTYDGTNPVSDLPIIADNWKVTIAQANDGDSANVYLFVLD